MELNPEDFFPSDNPLHPSDFGLQSDWHRVGNSIIERNVNTGETRPIQQTSGPAAYTHEDIPEDPGALDVLGHSILSAASPVVGLLRYSPMVQMSDFIRQKVLGTDAVSIHDTLAGIPQHEQQELERVRNARLEANPDSALSTFAAELGGQLAPMVLGGLGAGKVVTSAAEAIPAVAGSRLLQGAAGMAGAATEGALYGAGGVRPNATPSEIGRAALHQALMTAPFGAVGPLAGAIGDRIGARTVSEPTPNNSDLPSPQITPAQEIAQARESGKLNGNPVDPSIVEPILNNYFQERNQALQDAQAGQPQLPSGPIPGAGPDSIINTGTRGMIGGRVTPINRPPTLDEIDARWHPQLMELAKNVDSTDLHLAADSTEAAATPQIIAPRLFAQAPNPEAGFIGTEPKTPEPPSLIRQYVAPDPAAGTFSGMDFLKNMWSKWQIQMVAKDQPIFDIAKSGNDDMLANLATRVRGVAEMARGPLMRGTRLFDASTGEDIRTGDSLRSILGGIDSQALTDLEDKMLAERQLELHDRANSQQQQYADAMDQYKADYQTWIQNKASGMSPKEAGSRPIRPTKDIINVDQQVTTDALDTLNGLKSRWGNQYQQLDDMSNHIRDWSVRAILDPLREVGRLDDTQYNNILNSNEKYAPFLRVAEDIESDSPSSVIKSGQPIKEITGGLSTDKLVAPPLESLVTKAQEVTKWVERQRIRNRIADIADADPDVIGKEIQNVGSGRAQKPSGPGTGLPAGIFGVWRNGEFTQYTAGQDLLNALQGGTPKQANMIMKALQAPAKMLRLGSVLSPDFMGRHPIRDQWAIGVYSENGSLPFQTFIRGLYEMSPMGQKLSPIYDEFRDSGGALAGWIDLDRPNAQSTLADVTRSSDALGRMEQFVSDWRKEGWLYPLRVASETALKATRVGEFANARDQGLSTSASAASARDVALDFARSGNVGQQFNSINAFANVHIQDMSKFFRAMQDRPVATLAKAGAYIVLPSILNYAKNYDNPDYQSLPEWDKMLFYHPLEFHTDAGEPHFIRLPRPIGILNALFSYGPQKAMDLMLQKDPNAITNFLHGVANMTPIHFVYDPSSNPDDSVLSSIGRGLMSATPTAIQPLANAASGPGGYDPFRDAQIVPSSQQDLIPEEQKFDTTSPTLISVGHSIGQSPLKLDYLLRGYTGGLGHYALAGVDKTAQATGLESSIPPLPTTAKDIPGVAGYVSVPAVGFSSQPVSQFYQLEQQATKIKFTLDKLMSEGRSDAYISLFKAHPEVNVDDVLQDTKKRLSEMRNLRSAIRMVPGIAPETRALRLNEIDTAATQTAAGVMQAIADSLRNVQASKGAQ